MAKSENHQHESPLDPADAAQKSDRSFVDQPRERQEQEYIDRDKDNKHSVPPDINPIELRGNRQISPQKQPAVGFFRFNHGEIFFQRKEGEHHQGKERNDRVEKGGQTKNEEHAPPGLDAKSKARIVFVRLNSAHHIIHQMDD